jgi:hypothetical protein
MSRFQKIFVALLIKKIKNFMESEGNFVVTEAHRSSHLASESVGSRLHSSILYIEDSS